MFKFLYTFFWLLPVIVTAQKITVENGKLNGILPINDQGKVSYQLIPSVEGVSKDELFKRARKWFVKTYNSANQVLQVNDAATGELSGKGFLNISESIIGATHIYPVRHLLTVDVKDGRYRATLTDFVVDDRGGTFAVEAVPTMGRKWIDRFYTKINAQAVDLLTSLQKAMATADDF